VSNERTHAADSECGTSRAGAVETAFIIDDDRLMAALLERHLARRGIEAVRFEDPASLLGALPAARPVFLFTDLDMPLMRGTELISRVRAEGFAGGIVLVTASREPEDFAAAAANGADEILVKPLRDADLDFVVEKMRRRARRPVFGAATPRDLLEPIGQGIVLLDEEFVPIHINRRAREILGAGSEREAREALERDGLGARIMNGRRAGGCVNFVDVPVPDGNGSSRLLGLEIHECAETAAGRSYLVLMHDFSEWRKLDELHLRFATSLSHRMRTPLTSARNAVMILSEKGSLLDGAERERFLDIGCRSIEKLISSFDELQSEFLVESGSINVWRSLIRLDTELGEMLADLERRGAIGGFKMRSSDIPLLTCRSLLKRYIAAAAEAIGERLGEVPSIECAVAACDAGGEGAEDPRISISIRPGNGSRGERLDPKDHDETGELAREATLERLARALGGVHAASDRDGFHLRLPASPALDREKDLVHPLHMMIERSRLRRVPLHVVSVRMAGARADAASFNRLFESGLCSLRGTEEWVVARGWEPGGYDVIVAGASRERVDEAMESVRERFARRCGERGEELYPAIRWEIRYSREADAPGDAAECSMLETLI
jgi:DNA-binding response OmpR family regulator